MCVHGGPVEFQAGYRCSEAWPLISAGDSFFTPPCRGLMEGVCVCVCV